MELSSSDAAGLVRWMGHVSVVRVLMNMHERSKEKNAPMQTMSLHGLFKRSEVSGAVDLRHELLGLSRRFELCDHSSNV